MSLYYIKLKNFSGFLLLDSKKIQVNVLGNFTLVEVRSMRFSFYFILFKLGFKLTIFEHKSLSIPCQFHNKNMLVYELYCMLWSFFVMDILWIRLWYNWFVEDIRGKKNIKNIYGFAEKLFPVNLVTFIQNMHTNKMLLFLT